MVRQRVRKATASVVALVFPIIALSQPPPPPRRDPFDKSKGSDFVCKLLGPPPVSTLTLQGIVASKGVHKAMLVTTWVWPPGGEKMLVAEVGTTLYDGRVISITQDAVTIQELLRSPEGQEQGLGERVVVLTLTHPQDDSLEPPPE